MQSHAKSFLGCALWFSLSLSDHATKCEEYAFRRGDIRNRSELPAARQKQRYQIKMARGLTNQGKSAAFLQASLITIQMHTHQALLTVCIGKGSVREKEWTGECQGCTTPLEFLSEVFVDLRWCSLMSRQVSQWMKSEETRLVADSLTKSMPAMSSSPALMQGQPVALWVWLGV